MSDLFEILNIKIKKCSSCSRFKKEGDKMLCWVALNASDSSKEYELILKKRLFCLKKKVIIKTGV